MCTDASRVKQVAQEDLNQASQLANDAVRSGAYLYPFKVATLFSTSVPNTDAPRALLTSSPTVRYGGRSLRS
jgi:hypothetical protein